MTVLFYLFHSLSLKLPNNIMNFAFPPLKLPNKGREEYSKIIFFIPFYFISFSPPKRGLKVILVRRKRKRRDSHESKKQEKINKMFRDSKKIILQLKHILTFSNS